MVNFVVFLNILLSLGLFYLAKKIWNIKQTLAKIADRFNNYEQATYIVLQTAPNYIYLSQEKIKNLHENQQKLTKQIQQLRQIFNLIVLGRKIWQRSLF
ncbi:hypothetical protein H6F32_12460 [Anabaena sp. FACHB-1237]|uniref:hypothetical protein n=1 Tax=Anabaena sp. FACHB-1237 TaxID=2692769 RepID=UPI001680FA3C|nr:hypothetical protein [Anabaena sp. FACHB-1237]MBD2138385.1 hypothetical protein [Anabaena sp. FACHB-1237]